MRWCGAEEGKNGAVTGAAEGRMGLQQGGGEPIGSGKEVGLAGVVVAKF